MNRKKKWIVAGFAALALAGALPSQAQTTANVALYSQYVFRGLTQTDRRPALQGGFDYTHKNGLYAGIWGSNVSWISDFTPGVSASVELDGWIGWKRGFGDGWGWDLGFITYRYPGSYPGGFVKPDTDELYGALSWKIASLKYSRSLGDTFGVADSEGTDYVDLTIAVPLKGATLTLHGGHQRYAGEANDELFSYTDWKAELAKGWDGGWSAGVGYTGTDAEEAGYTPASTGRFLGEKQGYAFLKRSF
jgi:uncharacterized protein (TIGR02001 family)